MPQVVFKFGIKMKSQRVFHLFRRVKKVFKFYSVVQNKCVYMPQVVLKCRIKMKSQRVWKENEKQLLDT